MEWFQVCQTSSATKNDPQHGSSFWWFQYGSNETHSKFQMAEKLVWKNFVFAMRLCLWHIVVLVHWSLDQFWWLTWPMPAYFHPRKICSVDFPTPSHGEKCQFRKKWTISRYFSFTFLNQDRLEAAMHYEFLIDGKNSQIAPTYFEEASKTSSSEASHKNIATIWPNYNISST